MSWPGKYIAKYIANTVLASDYISIENIVLYDLENIFAPIP